MSQAVRAAAPAAIAVRPAAAIAATRLGVLALPLALNSVWLGGGRPASERSALCAPKSRRLRAPGGGI